MGFSYVNARRKYAKIDQLTFNKHYKSARVYVSCLQSSASLCLICLASIREALWRRYFSVKLEDGLIFTYMHSEKALKEKKLKSLFLPF